MKVLIINPGATSTKIAVFDEEEQLFKKSIDHSAQELDRFDRVIDQADFRQKAILDAVTEGGFRLTDFAAVCGRGGLYRPIPSGTYAVNDRVMHDVETAPYGEHPSNLGAYLARRIGDMVGIPAFFVDPVCVDEMTDVAHYTGFADFRRLSQFHALNQKSIGRKAAAALGRPYEQVNLIVCHLGGGVSVAAHHHGRVVDVFNVKDEGSMGMDRAGGVSAFLLGHGQTAQFPLSPSAVVYPKDLEEAYSPDSYRSAMETAGYTSGEKSVSVTMLVNEENSFKVSMARKLASDLSQYDVKILSLIHI